MSAPTTDQVTTDTAAPARAANVIEAILAVMRDVKAVGKTEKNTTPGQQYNFRGIDSTVNALGPAMRKHGLVVIPTLQTIGHRPVVTAGNKSQQASDVTVEYRFYGPGGLADTISTVVPGESWDSGDKGVAKAMSVAFRIALLQTFALPTDEREADADTFEGEHFDVPAFEARVDNALGHKSPADRIQALIGLGNRHGREVLAQVPLRGPDGAATNAADLITLYIEQAEAEGARANVERAQATAEGPARDVHAEGSAGQGADARAQASAQDAAPAQQHPAQAAENARVDARAQQREQRAQSVADKYRDEVRGQAEVLGLEVHAHIGPFLKARQVSNTADLSEAVFGGWVRAQRGRVIAKLTTDGRMTEAKAYSEAAEKGLVGSWGQLLGHDAAMAEDSAAAHQPAAS